MLYQRTQQLLLADGRSALDIHKQSGIPFHWLRKFRTGECKQPSVNTVEALYSFLTKSKLFN